MPAAAARSSAIPLAVGNSLRVQPATDLCEIAALHGAAVVIVNNEPTLYDDLATEIIREPISEALPALVVELTRLPH